ncbi:MAG: Trm112 family protein [Candidatus Schekmanbacteria bacterium]|nr:Trm112 family protein [Candidatus Schekmanbacteria bacterium]
MALDADLLEILRCPESKERLIYFLEENVLFCPASRLKYPIRDDIPVMLISEAERVTPEAADALVAQARERGLWQ